MVLSAHSIVVLSMLLAATAVIRESCVCWSGSVWDSTAGGLARFPGTYDRRLDAHVGILKF